MGGDGSRLFNMEGKKKFMDTINDFAAKCNREENPSNPINASNRKKEHKSSKATADGKNTGDASTYYVNPCDANP